jgi:hypothetical protein
MWNRALPASELAKISDEISRYYCNADWTREGSTGAGWTLSDGRENSFLYVDDFRFEQLIECGAFFQELNELTQFFGIEEAEALLREPDDQGPEGYALRHLLLFTGLESFHPVHVALLDATLAAFLEPELAGGATPWNEIAAGDLLRRVAFKKFDHEAVAGVGISRAWPVALELLEVDPAALSAQYSAAADRLEANLAIRDGGVQALLDHHRVGYAKRQIACFRLRATHPWIFAFPQLALVSDDLDAWNRRVSAVDPPLSFFRDGCEISSGRGIAEFAAGSVELFVAMLRLSLADLRSGGNFARAGTVYRFLQRFADPGDRVFLDALHKIIPSPFNTLVTDQIVQHAEG